MSLLNIVPGSTDATTQVPDAREGNSDFAKKYLTPKKSQRRSLNDEKH
jgi:hypothetical protein